mmetsp:Transcript_56011/g.181579  ORF Transcript_56011/g.181579 Transcript_56011/m.181579 type:complete len:510 (+) Transcript_56011:49-1578(+)
MRPSSDNMSRLSNNGGRDSLISSIGHSSSHRSIATVPSSNSGTQVPAHPLAQQGSGRLSGSPRVPSAAPQSEQAPPSQALTETGREHGSAFSAASDSVFRLEPKVTKKMHVLFKSMSHIVDAEESSGSFSMGTARRKSIKRRSFTKIVWRTLEDNTSSLVAKIWARFIVVLILCGVVNSWVEVVQPDSTVAPGLTIVLQMIFAVELLLRFLSCPNPHHFFVNVYNLFDLLTLLTVAPALYVAFSKASDTDTATYNDDVFFSIRSFIPMHLLLKLLRRFRTFHLLISAFHEALEALPVLLYTMLVIVLGFTAVFYIVEPRSSIRTLPESLWLVVVSIFTVGYHPAETVAGRFVSSAIFVVGMLYMAIPLGIVGNAFNKVWLDRERLMLLQQVREHFSHAGYNRQDIRDMFESLDTDGDSQLTFSEFRQLLPLMHIDLPEEVAYSVFMTFDDDGEGTIDFNEFLLGVYPIRRLFSTRKSMTSLASSDNPSTDTGAEMGEPTSGPSSRISSS